MTATLGRLVRFASVSPWRIAVSAVLGVLAVGFGVALIGGRLSDLTCCGAAADSLSDRDDRRGLRFFGLARPLASLPERIASH